VKRNTIVLVVVLFVLSTLAWAGWANFEYRKQAAEARMTASPEVELIPDPAGGPPQLTSPLVGKAAAPFTLETLDGKKISLADYKGKAVVVNFWATWCGPCRIETPWIIELRNKYQSHGLEVLALSADDLDYGDKAKVAQEKQEIARSAAQLHMPYPVLINGASLSETYGGLDSLPTTFFIDRKGVIVAAQIGLSAKDDIEAKMKKALGE
jgi:cytochrome c biogenesis protein CcmG/thiol:disulfide interchange protein DsbE